ncbi:SDR family oxidoreductase [Roseivirga pacifica]|uniref:SDR family oxidoreductase n=1 Tax=Roseivirga pacifica TaxID=1267423 RepID=UPI003BB15C4C
MNPTILITGASSGIGRATAALFASKGWNVIAGMRNTNDGEALKTTSHILIVELDVTSLETIQTAINLGIEKFGKIDTLLNNAGYAQYGIFESISDKKIRQQFEINLFGSMNVTRALLPHMRKQRQGTIINVSSGSGRFSVPLMSAYNASKFALEGFSESLAYELASQNIRVKIIEPGKTSSNFQERLVENYTGLNPPKDYGDYVEELESIMKKLNEGTSQNSSTPNEIAEVIYLAANDRNDTLRYVFGSDITPIIQLRTEASEQEYIDFMKNLFSKKT